MIDMGMGQEQVDIGYAVFGDRFTEIAQTGAGIKDEKPGPAADLDTGGVSPIEGGFFARAGDRPANAPEAD
jgi:hypothetical protein